LELWKCNWVQNQVFEDWWIKDVAIDTKMHMIQFMLIVNFWTITVDETIEAIRNTSRRKKNSPPSLFHSWLRRTCSSSPFNPTNCWLGHRSFVPIENTGRSSDWLVCVCVWGKKKNGSEWKLSKVSGANQAEDSLPLFDDFPNA
jgi:hypothetical protein